MLGVTLEKKGMKNEAVRHYKKALRLDDRLPEANYHYANMLYEKGNIKESIRYYRKVLEVRSSHKGAKYRLQLALKRLNHQKHNTK